MVRLTRRGRQVRFVFWVMWLGVMLYLNAQLPSEEELMRLCNDC